MTAMGVGDFRARLPWILWGTECRVFTGVELLLYPPSGLIDPGRILRTACEDGQVTAYLPLCVAGIPVALRLRAVR